MLSYLYAWETQPGIYGQLLHPSTEELNYTRRDRVKKGVLVNTPTFDCIPMLMACLLSKKKNKKWVTNKY
jgi:hypothetical protein